LACFSATGQLRAAIKSCQADVDCVTKMEVTDCCGTLLDVGVSASSATQFDACETAWQAHFLGRPCGPCTSPPPVAKTEDGQTVRDVDSNSPQVRCARGECMTYLPGASANAGDGSAEASSRDAGDASAE
jgi:hypothetical protein